MSKDEETYALWVTISTVVGFPASGLLNMVTFAVIGADLATILSLSLTVKEPLMGSSFAVIRSACLAVIV